MMSSKEIFKKVFKQELGYTEEETEKILARSAEIKKEIEEEERTERNEIASLILNAHGIEHDEIVSASFGAYKKGIPFADIWYQKGDRIIGIVLEHFGDWKLHIHDGKVVD